MSDVVLDTSVLRHACDAAQDPEKYGQAVALMSLVLEEHTLVLDVIGEIEGEYRKTALHPRNPYINYWWERLVYTQRSVCYEHGRLDKGDELIAVATRCHRKDFKFLAVAKRRGAPIMHEDSDYELTGVSVLGIRAHRLAHSLSVLQSSP